MPQLAAGALLAAEFWALRTHTEELWLVVKVGAFPYQGSKHGGKAEGYRRKMHEIGVWVRI